jgi:hypothetical protein
MSVSEAEAFLSEAAAGRYPAFSWKDQPVGTSVSGRIVEVPRVVTNENKFTGKEETSLVVPLEQPDGEVVTLWVKKGFMASAVAEAVREAGAKGLAEGGTLAVKFIEERDTGKGNPAKVYRAKYTAPAPTVAIDDEAW